MQSQQSALRATDPSSAQQADIAARGSAIVSATLNQLEALPQPPADHHTLARLYRDVDRVAVDASRQASALEHDQIAEAFRAEQTLNADARLANAASIAYGLTVCGQP
jgi:hypothetical protein